MEIFIFILFLLYFIIMFLFYLLTFSVLFFPLRYFIFIYLLFYFEAIMYLSLDLQCRQRKSRVSDPPVPMSKVLR